MGVAQLPRNVKRAPTSPPSSPRLDPSDDRVQGKARAGVKVCILGDTCDPRGVLPIAAGCDLLVHEVRL